MEISTDPWYNWCRLCAKEDPENNVNIHFSGCRLSLKARDVELTIKEALEKYFWVQSSCEDLLPKYLCLDCYSLISSILLFNERVERVQQMYNFLLENPTYDSSDLKSVRIKFDVSDCNVKMWCHSQNEVKDDCGTERFTVRIKQESCDIEPSISEYEGNNEVDNESRDLEELVYDKEYIDESQEDEDPFETMSEDSLWGQDEEMYPKGTTKKPTSGKNKQYMVNTVRTSTDKRRREELGDINCNRKKKAAEDFVFYVACKECGQKFDLYSTYCEHMEESHGNAGTDKNCPICDRNLQTWYHLGRHMRVHMPLEYRKPIKCPECDNRYTSSAQLHVHVNHKHRNEKPFICEVCGFCGATKNSLTQHMYMHTDNAPFECEVCKKKFKKKSRLNFHMDVHGPNKFICAICGLQQNSRATLKNHLLVHSDEKRHKCDNSGKAFKHSKTLKTHLLLHAGLKPYSCNFCDLTYNDRTNCRRHMKKMHPDELAILEASGNQPYTKNVPKLETLKAVTKSADNLKPIVVSKHGGVACEFCDVKFSVRQSCRAHMKTKHPIEFASLNAFINETYSKTIPNFKTLTTVDCFEFGKSKTCDFCDRTYASSKYCRAHIRAMHSDRLTSGDKTHSKNLPKLEKAVTKAADNLTAVYKFSDGITNPFESIDNSKSPIESHELAILEASGNKPYTKNVQKLETLKAATKSADNLKPIDVSKHGGVACEFCDAKFSVRQSCRAHMKTKHPIEFASLNAFINETYSKNIPNFKTLTTVDCFEFGKSKTCDFCDRTYASSKYCRAHIRAMHSDRLTSGDKTHSKNLPKLEKAVTKAADNLTAVSKSSDGITNPFESIDNSKSPIDLTPCASTTTATNIQDHFLLLE